MELADRIKQLLGRGLSGTVVASAVGCDPSYISQLMENEEFKTEVLALRAGDAEAALGRDDRWNRIEDKALEKMEQLLPLVTRPTDVIRIAQMANAAKRTARELAHGNESSGATVNLILPESAVIHFQMNSNAQVVEVDGRSMQALPTNQLTKQLADRREQRQVLTDMRVPTAVTNERKKAVSTLEAIGFSEDSVVDVPNILENRA